MQAIGKRLSQPTAGEVQETIYRPLLDAQDAGDFDDMLAVNEAHLAVLEQQALLPRETASQLARAMLLLRERGPQALEGEHVPEDPYFAFELGLTKVAGAQPVSFLHAGRSRNDIGATLDRLRALRLASGIQQALLRVRLACLDQAERHVETVMTGYTHLQPAQPITFGFLMLGYAEALARDSLRLEHALQAADACGLGVAALAGTVFPVSRAALAGLLGFQAPTSHGLDTVASRDFVTELLFAVVQLGVTWSRIAQDMHTLASDEFAAVIFPDAVSGISSIMPQKKNPVALEFLRAQSARSIGALSGTLAAVRGTHFTVVLDAIREGLADAWRVLRETPGHLRLLERLMTDVTPREAALAGRCRANFSTATDLADSLVMHCGIGFRDAHHIVGHAVSLALARGLDARGLDTALVECAAVEQLGHPLKLEADLVEEALDPEQAVRRRIGQGGTAPGAVRVSIQAAREQWQGEEQACLRRQADHAAVAQRRLACIRFLAGQ